MNSSIITRAGAALALAVAGSAFAGIQWGVDRHNSESTPLPPAMRINSHGASKGFISSLTDVRVMSFEQSQGVSASYAYPAPFAGVGVNPTVDFGGGVTAAITNGVVRFQTPGTAGPDHQPSGRYATDGAHYLSQAAAQMTLAFNTPQNAFGFWGIDIGDFGGVLTITLSGVGEPLSFQVAPESMAGQTSGSVLFWSFFDSERSFTNVTFTNSLPADVFSFDQFTIGRLVPAPGAGLAMAAAVCAGLGKRRRRQAD